MSVGVIWKSNVTDDFYNIKITSFADEDEKKLLTDFITHPKLGPILDKIPNKFDKNKDDCWALVGHNIAFFDDVFISKRLIINGLKPPKMFDTAHLKPWELTDIVIDTQSLWGFNVYDNSASSLDLLCEIFNIPTSKEELSGDKVKDTFWIEKNLPKIAKYCEADVLATARIVLKMKSMSEEIVVFEPKEQQ